MGNSTRQVRNGNPIKLAVFGRHNSGKNTFLRQISIVHGNGFTDDEKQNYKLILRTNILRSFKDLIIQARRVGIKIDNEEACKTLTEIDPYRTDLTPELVAHIKNIWNNGMKDLYHRRNEFDHEWSNTEYCMKVIDNLADPQYIVSNEDILNARIRSTGTNSSKFKIDQIEYEYYSLNEQFIFDKRTRDPNCGFVWGFPNTYAGVIFFAALDEWDETTEGPFKTKFEESLDLFEQLINDRFCGDLPYILILNKKDTFKDKITWNDMSRVYPEYTGGSDYNQAIEFIKNLYLARADPTRQKPARIQRRIRNNNNENNNTDDPNFRVVIETFVTCALDTEEMKELLDSITQFVLK